MRNAAALLLVLAAVAPASAESARSGAWTYNAEPSSTGKGGIVTALSPAPSPSGDPNDPSYLIARCMSGRTEFLVGGSGGWGLSGRTLEVQTRIDGQAPQTSRWDVATNGKAVFLDAGVEAFLKTLPEDGRLQISIKDGAGGLHENVFPTKGFGEVRAKIAAACGWAE